jgi:hypothetical protein
LAIFSNGEEERQRLERMKHERAESDHLYTANLVKQMERRLEEE